MNNENDENMDDEDLPSIYSMLLSGNEKDVTAKTYALAMLSMQLCPELCKTKPDEAITIAEKLLWAVLLHQKKVKQWASKADAGRKQRSQEVAKGKKEPVSYSEAVRFICDEYFTAHPKLYRAKERFIKFWANENGITEREAKRQLRDYEDGKRNFTCGEALNLKEKYDALKLLPKKKKGKQGRRTSDHDGRLRTDLVGLVPTKPRKPR